jgi:hypothetical protein
MNARSIQYFPRALPPLLAMLSMAATAAACGSDTAASGAGKSRAASAVSQHDSQSLANPANAVRKPCDYMARADAEAAVGQPLPATREDVAAGECDYTTADFFGATFSTGDWKDISYAATHGSLQPVSISGLGDEALNLNGPQGSDLFVRKGARGFRLGLSGSHIDGCPIMALRRRRSLP